MGDVLGTNNNYKSVFDDFETYLKKINDNNTYGWNSTHKGYLVNHNDFEKMRNKVSAAYEMRKNSQQNPNQNEANNEKIQINQLKTLSLTEAKNLISAGNKIIIINTDVYESICIQIIPGKENHLIKYKIDNGFIVINPHQSDEIKFKNNGDNIIDLSNSLTLKASNVTNSIKDCKNFENNYKIIYEAAKSYYDNETNISSKLKTNTIPND